jgi:lipopolysaccharide export system protein LptA
MASNRVQKNWFQLAALVVAGLWVFADLTFAQVPAPGNVIPDPEDISYFDGVYPKVKKLDVTGKEGRLDATGKLLLIKQFKAESYRLVRDRMTNQLELIVEAPECLFDRTSQQASSPGPLKVHSGDGRLLIEGVGFLLRQGSNNNLVLNISNQVSTTIKGARLGQSPIGDTNAAASNTIVIHSGDLTYDRSTDLITYTKDVHAGDQQTDLTTDVLRIGLNTNNAVQNVVADRNVVISITNGGHIFGTRAVYEAAAGNNFVTITGEPRWEDGLREGTATQFIYNGIDSTFRAEGDAHFKLPRNSFTNSDFGLISLPAGSTSATNSATNLIELSADSVTVQRPTNGPIQGMIAERNVVVLDPDTGNRATGDRGVYSAETGRLQLIGNAALEGGLRLTRADVLEFNRVNQTLVGQTNAFIRLPVASLGHSLSLSNSPSSGRTNATNLFLEVRANWYEYAADVLTFREKVRGTLLEGDTPRVTLNCDDLAVTFLSNNVQRVVARTNVYAHQLPLEKKGGRIVERELKCDQLQVLVRTNGLIEEMDASGNCHALQDETIPGRSKPVRSTAAANLAKAFFRPDSNAVDHAYAEQDVVLTYDDRTARGARLDYTATNDTATLTGDPSFETVSIRITSRDAIVYDHAQGKFNVFTHPRAVIPLTPEMLSKARAKEASKPSK